MKRLMTGVLIAALLLSQTSIADVFVKTDAVTVAAAEQDADANVDTDIGDDADVNTDVDVDVDTDTDTDVDADVDSDVDIDTDTDVDAGIDADTDADTYPDTDVSQDDNTLGGGTADEEDDTMLLSDDGIMAVEAEEVEFGGGDGSSPDSAYEISTEAQLRKLADDVNGGEKYYGTYFKMTQDITLHGEWIPIACDVDSEFQGIFDGGNHKIEGLTITSGDSSWEYCGLFGEVSEGTVQNLTVKGVINSTITVTGGIVGRADAAKIINCSYEGTISSSSSSVIGGIAAEVYSGTKIIDCRNKGDINGSVAKKVHAGGITGYASGDEDGVSEIINCKNEGSVHADVGSNRYAGGIAGWSFSAVTITDCQNTGSISAQDSYAGGIVGLADVVAGNRGQYSSHITTIANCLNENEVQDSPSWGEFVGEVSRDADVDPITIKNCYYKSGSGKIVGSGTADDVDVENVEEKNEEEFASGEVAYLLQNSERVSSSYAPQDGPVWGQNLGVDGSPGLVHFMEGDKEAKRVFKITLYDADATGYTSYKTYINNGATIKAAYGFEQISSQEQYPAEIYETVGLSGDGTGDIFREDTPITEDNTVLYIFYKEKFSGNNGTITTSPGTEKTQDLDEQMEYAGDTSAAGNFTYEIADGNDTLEASVAGSMLTIPDTATPGDYALTIKATEKNPIVKNLQKQEGVTIDSEDSVTFEVKVSVVGTLEQTPEASVDRQGGKIKDLVPGAKYDITYTDEDGKQHTDKVTADGNGNLEIEDEWLGKSVDIVKKGNDDDVLDSLPQELEIPEREPAPSDAGMSKKAGKDGKGGSIGGLTPGETYQISKDGGETWEDVTADDKGEISPIGSGSYDIRKKAGDNTLPSKSVQVEVTKEEGSSGGSTGGDSGNTGSGGSTGGNNGGSSSGSGNGSQSSDNNSNGTGTRNGRGNSTATNRAGTSSSSSAGSTDNQSSSQSASADETTNSAAGASSETGGDAGQSDASGTDGQTTGSTAQTVKAELKDGKITVEGDVVVTGTVRTAETTTKTLTVGEGAVIVTVVSDEYKGNAGVADTVAVANAVLTPEQIQRVNDGETIEIRVDVKDISGQVSQEDKDIIENGLAAEGTASVTDGDEAEKLTLGAYIDISMYIRIGDGDWDAITRADEPIEVVIGIPDELQDSGRTYYIARAHEGEYALLEDLDNEPDTITIKTGMFSTYAIVFKQMPGAGADASSGFLASLSWTAVALWSLGILVMIALVVILILGKRRKEEDAS